MKMAKIIIIIIIIIKYIWISFLLPTCVQWWVCLPCWSQKPVGIIKLINYVKPTNQNGLRIYHVSNHPKAKLWSHPSYLVVSLVANNYSYSFICPFKMSHFRMVLCAMDSFHLLQPTKVSFQLRESKDLSCTTLLMYSSLWNQNQTPSCSPLS
jgi:hypothetical protein